MVKYVGIGVAKAHFTELLRNVEQRKEHLVLKRRGHPIAIVQPYEPGFVEATEAHWASALNGIVQNISDFGPIMRDTVRSRRKSGLRKINLDR